MYMVSVCFFFFSSRRRHTRCSRDWSSDVCSSDLEHRDARKAPDSAAARPRLDDREERVKTLRGELVMDELIAIAVRPQNVPARGHRFHNGFWQGFAPFGPHPSLGCETNHFHNATLLSASVSTGASPRGIGMPREMALVSVEDQPHDLRPLRHVQRFLEELAAGLVSRHHNEKSVHPFLDDPTIGDRDEWRGVEDDVVVPPASLYE